jgi:hypothetical protein
MVTVDINRATSDSSALNAAASNSAASPPAGRITGHPPTGVAPTASTPPARASAPATLRPGVRGITGRAAPLAGAAARWSGRVGRHFRMPRAGDPPPEHRTLAVICGWAAALGLAGLIVGLLAVVRLIAATPGWYEPTVIAVGLTGIACTIGALTSMHQRRLPYALLCTASAALLLAGALTAAV